MTRWTRTSRSKSTNAPRSGAKAVIEAGGAGLTASMLLATYGIDHRLVSARPTTSDLPKAHVLNQRAMEVLDDVGVADGQRAMARSYFFPQLGLNLRYAGMSQPLVNRTPNPAAEPHAADTLSDAAAYFGLARQFGVPAANAFLAG